MRDFFTVARLSLLALVVSLGTHATEHKEVSFKLAFKTRGETVEQKLKSEFGKTVKFEPALKTPGPGYRFELTPQPGPLADKEAVQMIRVELKVSRVIAGGRERVLNKSTLTIPEDEEGAFTHDSASPMGLQLKIKPSL
jgi:hypothetical protein